MPKLLRRGFDVYVTLVDDQQIDCVVRLDENPPPPDGASAINSLCFDIRGTETLSVRELRFTGVDGELVAISSWDR